MKITIVFASGKSKTLEGISAVFCEAARLEMNDRQAAHPFDRTDELSQWRVIDPNLPCKRDTAIA